MGKVPSARAWRAGGRNGAAYTCKDNVKINCKRKALKVTDIGNELMRMLSVMGGGCTQTVPKNGILLRQGRPPASVVNGTQTSRDMA